MEGGGAKPFKNWKLDDGENLIILVKGCKNFSKLQGGGRAKSKPVTEIPEHVFRLSIAWSLSSSNSESAY